MLYAHFEQVESRVRENVTAAQPASGEQWHWGWHGDGVSEDKVGTDDDIFSTTADRVQ